MLLERSRYLGKKTIGPVARLGTAGVLLFASGACSGNKTPENPDSSNNPSSTSVRKATNFEFPFKEGNWRLTAGPHSEFGDGVRSSLDLAPEEVIPCGPNDGAEKYSGAMVTSPVEGTVSLIDQNTHKIEIAMKNGSGYGVDFYHLANLKIKQGETLKLGDDIGNPSCDGKTSGVHVHLQIERNGTPVPIAEIPNFLIAGEWQVIAGEKEYDGKLVNIKDGREIVADEGVCGPDQNSAMLLCGHTNFIPEDALLGSGFPNEVTETPTQENGDRNFVSQKFGYRAEIPDEWVFIDDWLTDSGYEADLFRAPDYSENRTTIEVSNQDTFGHDLGFYEALIELSMDQWANNYNGTREETIDIEIDGLEARSVRTTIVVAGKKYYLESILFVKNDKVWAVAYKSGGENNHSREELEKFIESFKVE